MQNHKKKTSYSALISSMSLEFGGLNERPPKERSVPCDLICSWDRGPPLDESSGSSDLWRTTLCLRPKS